MKSNQITSHTLISRIVDVAFSQLDDELLAINAQDGYCYSINMHT